MAKRTATVKRTTKETNVSLKLNLDGTGQWQVNTGVKMLDHFLAQVAQHGRFDLTLSATGDDDHHLIEDVAICFGKAFAQALGEKQGIVRMADAWVPMDDAMAMVVVDLSGRSYTVLDLPFSRSSKKWELIGFTPDLIRHFLESFATEARINLHARILYGENDHHKAESLFKALGRALDKASRIDERTKSGVPSTKDLL
jgi:imidazoleglycerol-phosphate dehydratase